MRCIDADALIEFIENRYDITWKDDYEGGIKDACVDILEEINKMPTIKSQQKWIPYSERLPEKNGRYLVTRGLNACGSLWNRVYLINHSDLMGLKRQRIWWQGNFGKSDFERLDDVLAWMPLPEPYEERRTYGN